MKQSHFSIIAIIGLILLLLNLTAPAHAVTCMNNMPPSNPDSIYTIHGNGSTVTDTRAGLTWKRCSEGQTWDGITCSGSASTFSWAGALQHAEQHVFDTHNDWRLPNIKELRSLVEECRVNPAINNTIFPNTSTSSHFWSASPIYGWNSAWMVYFFIGNSGGDYRSSVNHVRLVRGGQWFAPSGQTLTVNASGTTGVGITANPSTYSGTTNYTKSNIPNGTQIILTAPATSGSATFSSWSGCNSTSAANRTCTVSMAGNKTVTVNYVAQQTGSLRVTIEPSGARSAGAQWRRTGASTWLNSGATESNVSVGTHSIEFKEIGGWTKPASQQVTINSGQTTTTTGTYTQVANLGTCLDNTSLTWTTGGSANWFCQSSVAHHGGSAAQSGAITHNQQSWLQTTVTGPGTLRFHWRVSSEDNYDWLSFSIGGTLRDRISGTVNWQEKSFDIPSGTHTLKWEYSKDGSVDRDADAGWVDYVRWSTAPTRSLTVNSSGASSVPITGTPTTYSGTTNYSRTSIPDGTSITLTAPATHGGSCFTSWSGCDSTNAANRICTVNMTGNKTVTANYGSCGAFRDDFTNGLGNWVLFGSPRSVIRQNIHGKAYVFDNMGDSWHNSGAVSRQTVGSAGGYVIESDVYVHVTNVAGCWNGASIGLTRQPNPGWNNDGDDTAYGVNFSLGYAGDACWATPEQYRRHGSIDIGFVDENGNGQGFASFSTSTPFMGDAYMNKWVRLRFEVSADRTIRFLADGNLIWAPPQKLHPDLMQGRNLVLGQRSSGSAGKAYHDFISVGAASATTRIIRLTGDMSFGNVMVNQSATRTLTIHNDGNAALTVSSINYPAGFSGAWSGSIPAGGSRNVAVTFRPTAAQGYSGAITVNSDRTSGTHTRACSGTGVAATTRIIRLTGDMSFGNVMVNQSATRTLTIHNDGNAALTVSSINYPAGFSGAWSGSIPAGGSRNVAVTFRPTAAQGYSGAITVNSDRTSGTHTRACSGTGVQTSVQVTATAGAGGGVTPSSRSVSPGAAASFTVSPQNGFTRDTAVGGTCPSGSWNQNVYTTGAVSRSCTVEFGFSQFHSAATRTISGCNVCIRVTPPSGIDAWSVQETIPAGLTVGSITENGSWTASNRKISWGVFFNAAPRTLCYEASGNTGQYTVSGIISLNGVDASISGNNRITLPCGQLTHPADLNANWQLTMSEATAYAAAWKRGASWQNPPNPIDINFVTRAVFLFKNGEAYNRSTGFPPGCWVLGARQSSGEMSSTSSGSSANRSVANDGSRTVSMSIAVRPASGISGYAVEEVVPDGLTPQNIGQDGQWVPAERKIKWMFFDATARTLTYDLTGNAGTYQIQGTLSIDGTPLVVGGVSRATIGGTRNTVLPGVLMLLLGEE